MAFDALPLVSGRRARRALPYELEKAVKNVEDEFTVDQNKLREIIDRFETELNEGSSPC